MYDPTYSIGVENATPPVSPSQTSDKSRQAKGHAEEDGAVPFMLPPDDAVFAEVGDVGHAWLAAGFDNHSAVMGPGEAMVSAHLVEPWTAPVLAMASRYSSGLEAL